MNAAVVMSARFGSVCGACSAPIVKGSPIRYVKGFAANHEACGDPSTVYVAKSSPRRSSGRGSRWASNVCTHIDFPCCGCGEDVARGYVTGGY